jgi:broad specificity phosphatase PhoE
MPTMLWLATIVLSLFAARGLEAADPGAGSVWDALATPGAVVVLRHSYAPGGFDPPDARLDDCSTQRNLDAGGRAQAARIGDAFRRHGVTVGDVVSSPRCRCLDTARLAFGKVRAWDVLQGALRDADLRQRQLAEIRALIDAHRDGPPLVLVTHGSVVTDLTSRDIRMGAFVVLQRLPDGQRSVTGPLHVD